MAAHTMVSQGITFYSREINVMDLVTDEDSLQPREGYNDQVREELRVKFLAGEVAGIPGAFVFYVGGKFYVVDGFHRVTAAALAGVLAIQIWVARGTYTMDDAKIFAAGANTHTQTKMTQADKKKAAVMLFSCKGVSGVWSERKIARHVGCSDASVRRWHCRWSAERGKDRVLAPHAISTAHGIASRKSKELPEIEDAKRHPKGYCYVNWLNKRYYLGYAPEAAEGKLKELINTGVIRPRSVLKEKRIPLHRNAVMSWLMIRVSLPVVPRSAGGDGSFCEFRVGNPGAISVVRLAPELMQRTMPHFVGEALMDRVATGAARAVVLCYLPENCRELAATALKLGVEFLSPDEFVESINGAPVAATA